MLSILNFSHSENILWVHKFARKYRNKFAYMYIVCVHKHTQHTHTFLVNHDCLLKMADIPCKENG